MLKGFKMYEEKKKKKKNLDKINAKVREPSRLCFFSLIKVKTLIL